MYGARIVLIFLCTVLLAGCAFRVRHFDGYQAAVKDIEYAVSMAGMIKASNIDAAEKYKVRSKYNKFRAVANAYLQGLQVRISNYVLDESAEKYYRAELHEIANEFTMSLEKIKFSGKPSEEEPVSRTMSLAALDSGISTTTKAVELASKVAEISKEQRTTTYQNLYNNIGGLKVPEWNDLK